MYLIDLDGTMYSGNVNIDGAKQFIDYLVAGKLPFMFITNNASKTPEENVKHMESLGFNNIEAKHFYTSAMATSDYLKLKTDYHKVCYVGTPALASALLANGLELTDNDAEVVVVGLNKQLDYERLSLGLTNLINGARLVGTNLDRKIPHNGGFQLGNGSIVKMLEYSSDQEAIEVGKPNVRMLDLLCEKYQLAKAELIMVGDNLETDILFGINGGIKTIFVTTGVHQISDIERLGVVPTQTISNLLELIK